MRFLTLVVTHTLVSASIQNIKRADATGHPDSQHAEGTTQGNPSTSQQYGSHSAAEAMERGNAEQGQILPHIISHTEVHSYRADGKHTHTEDKVEDYINEGGNESRRGSIKTQDCENGSCHTKSEPLPSQQALTSSNSEEKRDP
jgi:hypothetical protein